MLDQPRKMARRKPRFAPYSLQVRNQLKSADTHNQAAFCKWQNEYIRDSKHSTQDNLPSSQLPSLESLVLAYQKQLFVMIDTCSLVKHQADFIDYVTNLRKSFRGSQCPIRFIIPLVVVEELDKCNRRPQKKQRHNTPEVKVDDGRNPPIEDVVNNRDPPRSFMRIIEEELRTFQIIVPDLDPTRRFSLPSDSLCSTINDNRILDSCIRSQRFIQSLPHHDGTKVILVTEDNNFKTKATTFQVPSFRWREFVMKYHNFGRKNCVETPLVPSLRLNTTPLFDNSLTGSSQYDIQIIKEVITVD
jgi:rRNA-processing protein FCF1